MRQHVVTESRAVPDLQPGEYTSNRVPRSGTAFFCLRPDDSCRDRYAATMASPDHVALVVEHLEPVIGRLDHVADQVGTIEDFPTDGSREIYVGAGAARLLIIEPTTAASPYARALATRGPGLHHVGLHTADLDTFLQEVRRWLLHPVSARTIPRVDTAWLARPGVPTLVEVYESEPVEADPFVSAIEVPADLDGLAPTGGLTPSDDSAVWLTIAGRRMSVDGLVGID